MSIFIAIEQCEQKSRGGSPIFSGGRGFSKFFDFSETKRENFKVFMGNFSVSLPKKWYLKIVQRGTFWVGRRFESLRGASNLNPLQLVPITAVAVFRITI